MHERRFHTRMLLVSASFLVFSSWAQTLIATNGLLLFALTAATVLAQTPEAGRGHVSIEAIPPDQTWIKQMREMLPMLDGNRLRSVAPESWEGTIANAGKAVAQDILNLDFGEPEGLYTYTDSRRDTLVARWRPAAPNAPEREIWLWDTGFQTVFVLDIDPALIRPERLPGYCETLLRWRRNPVVLERVKIQFLDTAPQKEQVIDASTHDESPMGLLRFRVSAIGANGKAYLGVMMTKEFFRHKYPHGSAFVDERFPPLQTRLRDSSRAGLFTELALTDTMPVSVSGRRFRTIFILEELLSRGHLSDSEVEEVLHPQKRQAGTLGDDGRLSPFLIALDKQHELAAYARPVMNVLLSRPPAWIRIMPSFRISMLSIGKTWSP